MEKEANIFEAASKKLSKKMPLNTNEKKKVKKDSKAKTKKKYRDPELAEMMENLSFMKQDLKKKFEEVLRKTGWTFEQIHSYIQNPKNLNPAEYEKLKKDQEALAHEIWSTIGPELKPKTAPRREKPQNERKGKTLGARKGWLPVH